MCRTEGLDGAETAEERFPAMPLGVSSLLWRYADQRMEFTGLTAGLLPLMHPGIGAAGRVRERAVATSSAAN